MKRVADIERFRADPLGCFTIGRNWLHFCASAELWGVAFFGSPERADAEALCRSLAVELEPGVARHRSLVDTRQLERADTSAFTILQDFARQNLERSRQRVSHVALVRPTGIEGAVAAGFYTLIGEPFELAAFDDIARALDWLGESDGSSIVVELEGVIAAERGTSPFLSQIQSLLREHLAGANPERLCKALAVSKRTLQRRLQDAGTTFEKELQRARIAEAERRLLESDDPLTAVALDLGFASPQHFSRQFREVTGESPSDWRSREQRRKGRLAR
jgi:AraC-like DNA-binding protein